MAVTVENAAEPQPEEHRLRPGVDFPTPPDLGRTVHIVGPVVNVNPDDTPHPRNSRGELGKPMFNYYRNAISPDPLGRVSGGRTADRRNVFTTALGRAPRGETRPERVPVDDPAAMTAHIKRVARFFGADIVGVARAHPTMMYVGGRTDEEGEVAQYDSAAAITPEESVAKYPYLILISTAWDYDKIQAHRHHIGDSAYHVSQLKANLIIRALSSYIQDLGYTALRGTANSQAAALAAGVGELGRNGLIISEKFGARVHMPPTIQTDLPLVAGKPIDLGVEDFCKVCRKCAVTCPTNSISFGEKTVTNGIEKHKINWLTCYRLRPYVVPHWGSCLTCATVCPYTKPNSWWRDLAINTLRATPVPARPVVVKALKAIDDRFWGVVRNKRVRWMGYDSGIKPGERACTIAGCTAQHDEAGGHLSEPLGKAGYYFPLKENTNRFVKRDGV